MNTDFKITETGIVFVTRFVKQVSDLEYGSVVTHEDFNEKLNLNATQGDYNTEILRLLFTDSNPANVPHIKYLDKIITDEINRIDTTLNTHQEQIDACNEGVQQTRDEMSAFTQQLTDIINGVTKVKHAVQADKITGAESAGLYKYYGTDWNGIPGFHEMPAAIYARDMSSTAAELDGIYYIPRQNSITEGMLTEELRTKLNRETISDYDLLTNRPTLAGVLLTGNITLEQIGAQPKGDYLTSIPSNYVTDAEVATAIEPYLLKATASDTYATLADLRETSANISELATIVDNFKHTAEERYARICINSFSGTPKTGDILINL